MWTLIHISNITCHEPLKAFKSMNPKVEGHGGYELVLKPLWLHYICLGQGSRHMIQDLLTSLGWDELKWLISRNITSVSMHFLPQDPLKSHWPDQPGCFSALGSPSSLRISSLFFLNQSFCPSHSMSVFYFSWVWENNFKSSGWPWWPLMVWYLIIPRETHQELRKSLLLSTKQNKKQPLWDQWIGTWWLSSILPMV